MGQLDDKTVFVTGPSSGKGMAIARRFAAEGATVYRTGRRKAALDAAVAQVGARGIAIQGDASGLGDLDRLFAEIANRSGCLDIVVANAGVGDYGPLGAITEEEYDRTASINLKGTVFTVQKALPLLTAGASVMPPPIPTRSPPPPSTWLATKAVSPPARNSSSTAAPHSSRRQIGDAGRIRRSRASEPRTCDRRQGNGFDTTRSES